MSLCNPPEKTGSIRVSMRRPVLPYLEQEPAGWLNLFRLQIYPRRLGFLKERSSSTRAVVCDADQIESPSTLEAIAKKKVSPYQRWRSTPEVVDGSMVSPSPGDSKHFSKGVHHAGVWDPTDCTKNVFLEEVVAVKRDVQ
ncbi:hypothetical protein U1Q18_021705 [Sarracenia purpurea var. burkii]